MVVVVAAAFVGDAAAAAATAAAAAAAAAESCVEGHGRVAFSDVKLASRLFRGVEAPPVEEGDSC